MTRHERLALGLDDLIAVRWTSGEAGRTERRNATELHPSIGLFVLLLLLCGACGGHGPVHTAPDESLPHISWALRTGGEFGDGEFVCGSAKPAAVCLLTASTDKERTLVMLHVYFHAAAAQTNYIGAWRAPFFRGWTPTDYRDVSGMVRPGGEPYDFSVSGIVTDKPGTSSFSLRLDAAQEGVPNGHRITLDIPVTVISSASATPERNRGHARPQ